MSVRKPSAVSLSANGPVILHQQPRSNNPMRGDRTRARPPSGRSHHTTNKWDVTFSVVAQSEGWDMWLCTDGRHYIQKIDALDRFPSDEEAIWHVRWMAACGSEVHRLAMNMHGTHGS